MVHGLILVHNTMVGGLLIYTTTNYVLKEPNILFKRTDNREIVHSVPQSFETGLLRFKFSFPLQRMAVTQGEGSQYDLLFNP